MTYKSITLLALAVLCGSSLIAFAISSPEKEVVLV